MTGQRLPVGAAGSVGDLIDLELAAARGAVARLDRATEALTEGRPGADDAYAAALAEAEALDAWDADRQVGVSLAVLPLDEPTNHLSAAVVDELTAALGATPARSWSPSTTGGCCATPVNGHGWHCDSEMFRYYRNPETCAKIVDSSSVTYSYFFSDPLLDEEEVRT